MPVSSDTGIFLTREFRCQLGKAPSFAFDKPVFIVSNMKTGLGLDEIVEFIIKQGMLNAA